MSGRRWRSLSYGGIFIATAFDPVYVCVGLFFVLMDFVEN